MQRPFLFVQCRPAGAIASDERATIEELGGLREGDSLRSLMLVDDPHCDPASDIVLDDYAGVIISGSPYSASAGLEAADPVRAHLQRRVADFVAVLGERDYPTLGLCYGLQMMAVVAGETLSEDYTEDLQAVTVTLTDEGLADPVTRNLPPVMRAFVGHTYALARTPREATLLGRGEFCTQQLLRFGRHRYGTQFHPEITTPGMQLRIDAYSGHYYAPDQARAVVERCMSQDVTSSHHIIRAFVDHYRDAAARTSSVA